jgi:hypothetical protein
MNGTLTLLPLAKEMLKANTTHRQKLFFCTDKCFMHYRSRRPRATAIQLELREGKHRGAAALAYGAAGVSGRGGIKRPGRRTLQQPAARPEREKKRGPPSQGEDFKESGGPCNRRVVLKFDA